MTENTVQAFKEHLTLFFTVGQILPINHTLDGLQYHFEA